MRDPLLGQRVGRYRVIAQLGQGGVARVYRAIQEPLGREVALKVVRPDLDEHARSELEERFLREAALAGRLSHANVVTVYDFGRSDEGLCYIAMELLRGTPLRAWMTAEGMSQQEVARIGASLARGLRHAHQRGLVHRDVKPGNIFLVRDDEARWQPQLLDFGLVKDPGEESITSVGTFLGTPHYIAPEQAQGAAVDAKADVYSLGIVLYRMICGRLPFEADNPMAIALKHLREEPPSFAERAPDVVVDASLERIVFDCLEKNPEERIDANTLAQRLDAWREGTISTLQPMVLEPQTTPPQRSAPSRALLGLFGAAVVGLVAGGVWLGTHSSEPTSPEPTSPEPAVVVVDAAPATTPESEAPPEVEAPPEAEAPPAPVPTPMPAPDAEPTPVVVAAPPPAASKPTPKPEPEPAEEKSIVVDDVRMTPTEAATLLAFINTADESELRESGVYVRGVNIILEKTDVTNQEKLEELLQLDFLK